MGLVNVSNDPGKKGSNLICCGAIRFPHIEMFSILRRECINPQKGSLRKKIYLNSTFKGCIFALKHFDQSQELQTNIRNAPMQGVYLRIKGDKNHTFGNQVWAGMQSSTGATWPTTATALHLKANTDALLIITKHYSTSLKNNLQLPTQFYGVK